MLPNTVGSFLLLPPCTWEDQVLLTTRVQFGSLIKELAHRLIRQGRPHQMLLLRSPKRFTSEGSENKYPLTLILCVLLSVAGGLRLNWSQRTSHDMGGRASTNIILGGPKNAK